MAKLNGAEIEFWFDGVEYPVISSNIEETANELDTTDSSTSSTAKDFEIGRVNRTISVEANLYDVDGAEIATGTLTAGTKYRVTAGTITEGSNTYELGRIFESDGTGTASASNKVKPLGAVVNPKAMTVTYDSTSYPVTSVVYGRTFDTQDTTDSATTGDGTEQGTTRADATLELQAIMRGEVADLFVANAVKKTVAITLQSGTTLGGSVIIVGENKTLSVNDVTGVTSNFKFKGLPTEVNLGLPLGVEKAFVITVKRGASTNKAYTGNAIILGKNINASINDVAKVSYTIQINGAVTKSVAN
jgi:hypothetical protein